MSLSFSWSTQCFSVAHLRTRVLLLTVLLVLAAASFVANEEDWSDGTILLPVSMVNSPHQRVEPASSTPALPSYCAEHCVHVVHGRFDVGLLATGKPLSLRLQPRRLTLIPFLSPPPLTPPPQ